MEKDEDSQNVPRSAPISIEINMALKRYSEPKIFIPKKNGKPTAEPGKRWYVYFYWRTDLNGPLNKKFTYTHKLNRLKTPKERKEAGRKMCAIYSEALERGWNPETKTAVRPKNSRTEAQTLEKALEYAFHVKKQGNKKQPTLDGYRFHLNRFLEWAKTNGWLGVAPERFGVEQFYQFLDWIRFEYVKSDGDPMSGTSINNHKRSLSSLFTTLKNERLITVNFIKDIPNVDEDPVNNKAFTLDELLEIKEALQNEDPYLVPFIQFMLYPLLRPREICRLRVKDINTEKWFLSVETKTARLSKRRIIEKMKPTLEKMNLENEPGNFFLFTNKNQPGDWEVKKLKSKVDHFGRRFANVKNKLGYGREYSLYSCRHTAIMDLFHSMQTSGMSEHEIYPQLMQYTQHRSVEGLQKYLRKHSHVLPPDHSEIYTIDF